MKLKFVYLIPDETKEAQHDKCIQSAMELGLILQELEDEDEAEAQDDKSI
jgi:hypothetical protein